jgi:16S rRNA A1518/A1519 N6-dimethyltransferase RsmA/KsgA/DIM1 with predicted DNA glycosylase/AP lyase activity
MNEVVKDQHYTTIYLITCKLGIPDYKLGPSIFKPPPPLHSSLLHMYPQNNVPYFLHICHTFETKSDFIIIKWQL